MKLISGFDLILLLSLSSWDWVLGWVETITGILYFSHIAFSDSSKFFKFTSSSTFSSLWAETIK